MFDPQVDSAQEPPPETPSASDFDPEQLERDRRLVAALLRKATKARTDPSAFFSFVMKEEHGQRRRLKTAPHQKVVLDFINAHDRCVVRMFAGAGKTYLTTSELLRLLGNDPTERGVVISAEVDQASKPLALARDYIANEDGLFPELRLVFPELRPSDRLADPWTQTAITVDRPAGIRDPSFAAHGINTRGLAGSRLSWILVDDVLNEENTSTPLARKKTIAKFASTVLSRRDITGAKIVVTNTPWHSRDLTYALESAGWPTVTLDVEGGICITNTDWDTPDIRPAYRTPGPYHRLVAHDSPEYDAPLCIAYSDGTYELATEEARRRAGPEARLVYFDLDEDIPLWPEQFGRAKIEQLRMDYANEPAKFAQLYLCRCRDDEAAPCKEEWVSRCKEAALREGHTRMVPSYSGTNLTVTGVDLAIGQKRQHDYTAFFTYELLPDGRRKILDVEYGRFTGKEIVTKVKHKAAAYNSIIRVETNGGQDFLRQWALDGSVNLLVRAHFTGENKSHSQYGIANVFFAFENGVWLIPCDEAGVVHPAIDKWIGDCLYFNPREHTGDVLVASWLATEQEREITRGRMGAGEQQAGSYAAALLAR